MGNASTENAARAEGQASTEDNERAAGQASTEDNERADEPAGTEDAARADGWVSTEDVARAVEVTSTGRPVRPRLQCCGIFGYNVAASSVVRAVGNVRTVRVECSVN